MRSDQREAGQGGVTWMAMGIYRTQGNSNAARCCPGLVSDITQGPAADARKSRLVCSHGRYSRQGQLVEHLLPWCLEAVSGLAVGQGDCAQPCWHPGDPGTQLGRASLDELAQVREARQRRCVRLHRAGLQRAAAAFRARRGLWVPGYMFKLVYEPTAGRAWVRWLVNDEGVNLERPIAYSELVKRTGIRFFQGS